MRILAVLLVFAWVAPLRGAPVCSVGMPGLTFQLVVDPGGGEPARSIRAVNRLRPGYKLVYKPVLRAGQRRPEGKVSLVLVPSQPDQPLQVLPPKPAGAGQQWEVPFRASTIALVYGPNGLDVDRVNSLVRADRELIEQLAGYAEQTTQAERLLEAIAAWDRSPSATENLNAALEGFSTAFGRPVPKLRRDAPAEEQLNTLLRALNPALATYDPLAPQPDQRLRQSAMLASSIASLIWGTPVGLAAGGAGLFVNLTRLLFPNTLFRSAVAQEADPYTLTLCVPRENRASRTRLAYLWAVRLPDADPPRLVVGPEAYVPQRAAWQVPAKVTSGDWRLLGRARDWRLESGEKSYPVAVRLLPEKEGIELDPKGEALPPGSYRLVAWWDWDKFEADGEVHVEPAGCAGGIELDPDSADSLVTGSGTVAVKLRNCDFQFTQRVELVINRDGRTTSEPLSFELPRGAGRGPQREMVVQVDTSKLAPGTYRLRLHLPAADLVEVPLQVLPPHPRLANLPLRLNLGEAEQTIELRGEGLDRVEAARVQGVEVELGEPRQDGVRPARFRLKENLPAGTRLDLSLKVQGVHRWLEVPGAVEILPPRPRILAARLALPEDLKVELRPGELPAGAFLAVTLRVEPLSGSPVVELACAEPELRVTTLRVGLGENRAGLQLRAVSPRELFLSVNPSLAGQPGCRLQVVVESEAQGRSDPHELGRLVRLPQIDRFELTSEPAGPGMFIGILEGKDLEVIEKVGWNASEGYPVSSLPAILGDGRHRLRIHLPWPAPAPHAPLYIWVRGDEQGRATDARY